MAMLQMKDMIQTQQGIVEVPAYMGPKREALKEELFKLTGVKMEEAPVEEKPEPKLAKEDV